ncbi:hypothetical protein GEMRC1_001120 [Eukaryota sp. GEM-RC1]
MQKVYQNNSNYTGCCCAQTRKYSDIRSKVLNSATEPKKYGRFSPLWKSKVTELNSIEKAMQVLHRRAAEREWSVSCTVASYNGDYVANAVSTPVNVGPVVMQNAVFTEHFFDTETKDHLLDRAFDDPDSLKRLWKATSAKVQNPSGIDPSIAEPSADHLENASITEPSADHLVNEAEANHLAAKLKKLPTTKVVLIKVDDVWRPAVNGSYVGYHMDEYVMLPSSYELTVQEAGIKPPTLIEEHKVEDTKPWTDLHEVELAGTLHYQWMNNKWRGIYNFQ